MAEVGVNGMEDEQWFARMGPANMPEPLVDKLAVAMEQVLAMPDVRERLEGMALTPAVPGRVELKKKLEADVAQWLRLAKELDIEPLE